MSETKKAAEMTDEELVNEQLELLRRAGQGAQDPSDKARISAEVRDLIAHRQYLRGEGASECAQSRGDP